MRYMLTNRRALDPFFGLRQFDAAVDQTLARATEAGWLPAVDIHETAEAWELVAELPGMAPEQVKIAVEGRSLVFSGEKTGPVAGTAARRERRFGSFRRSFTLPETAETETISAAYALGVLTIRVPKAAKAQPREIPVQIGTH